MPRSAVFLSGSSYEKVLDYGADLEQTRELIERFTQGQCAMLAERIYQVTGWPIVVLRESGQAVHWLNRRNDGAYVDAHGATPEFCRTIIATRHGATNPSWTERLLRFPMDADAVAEVDAFLSGDWMRAVIPLSDRLAAPLAPIEPDQTDHNEDDADSE